MSADYRLAAVTGAARGIGRAIADDLHANGWAVAYIDLNDFELAEDERRAPFSCDIADEAAVSATFAALPGRFGRPLWACFANAGITGGSDRFTEVTVEHFRRITENNLLGTFLTFREAARAMGNRGGRIVATASIAGMQGTLQTGTPYSAGKAGIINMVQQAALRLASDGITVNAICPGVIMTGIGGGRMRDPAHAAALVADVPLGRVGQPEDIVGLARLLAGDESSYITGQAIAVDGGATALRGAWRADR
jgi:NAD(P)-dependent dehydrogenase (short-subunit alcohol dehydrogenase family)